MNADDQEELEGEFKRLLEEGKEPVFDFEKEKILQQLHNSVLALKKEFNWTNTRIVNKEEELKKFKAAKDQEKTYRPQFKFVKFEYDEEDAIQLIEEIEQQAGKIDREVIKKKGFNSVDRKELRNLYRGIFEEFKLYVKLQSHIANRKKWRKICRRIWSPDEKTAKYAEKKLREKQISNEEGEKDLDASAVKDMWEEEVKRLGMDYETKVRNVSGCHNIPEERKLIVAAGNNSTRNYSLEEARMLTMHEVFHAVRTHNGYKAVEGTDVPPTLGIHTPFYDRAEEGGSVFREVKTRVITERKEKDYYLRTMAANYWHKGMSFGKIVDKLMKNGASLSRAFGLTARNREFMRHQIYLGGLRDWQEMEEKEPMMIGKVNRKWAEKLWKEAKTGGPLSKPDIKPEQLFQKSSFAFDT